MDISKDKYTRYVLSILKSTMDEIKHLETMNFKPTTDKVKHRQTMNFKQQKLPSFFLNIKLCYGYSSTSCLTVY